MMDAARRPYKPVRDALIDDWTGTRFANECYGPKDCAPPPFVESLPEKLTKKGYPTGKPLYTKSKGEKNDEEKDKSFLQLEPFDPNLAD